MTSKRSRDLLVFGTALIVLAADQIGKHWVRSHLSYGIPWDPLSWLRPIFSFTYITNTGAAFGLFPKLSWLYTVNYVVVIGLILYFYWRIPINNWLILLSLGLQLGGAMGNLVDRLWRGQVTDFLDLNFWPLHEWPVFNVADSCVVVGVCILAAYLLLAKEPSSSSLA